MFPIKTYFYFHKELVRVNSSKNPNTATESALKFMAVNAYGATTAQVVDSETGEVHSEVVLRKNGRIEISYLRDARTYERRLNLDHLEMQYNEWKGKY